MQAGAKPALTSWWDNKGVGPCYRRFTLALRLKGERATEILATGADITAWLPGDNVFDSVLDVPQSLLPGQYEIGLALVDAQSIPARSSGSRVGDFWCFWG